MMANIKNRLEKLEAAAEFVGRTICLEGPDNVPVEEIYRLVRQQVPDYSEEDQILRLFPTGRREPGVRLHFRSVGKRTFDLGTRLFTLPR